MNTRQKLLPLAAALALALASPGTARADGDQLYIMAWGGPAGSMSSAGQARTVVYVRWDLVEGILPSDVVRFRLYRGATRLVDQAAAGVMSADEIRALYLQEGQDRRRLELIDVLNRGREPGQPAVGAGNFHTALHAKLLAAAAGDKAAMSFAHLMGRFDVNVAVARGRAFIDAAPPAGTLTYRLNGVTAGGAEYSIGSTTANRATRVTPRAPEGLIQVRELGRCDAPDEALSHGTVALDWGHPGAGGPEALGSAVMIAGYDLYRSVGACGPVVPARDLRAEAAATGHGAAGRVALPGLVRVNDRPVMISGRPEPGPDGVRRQGTASGFNRAFAQHLETREELEAAGLHPGDRRCYYVVARDLAGNYGDTARVAVEVTNDRTPPAPQAAEVFPFNADGDAGDRLLVRWDHLEVPAFYREHRHDHVFCNLETAVAEGRLSFVGPGESCAKGPGGEAYLDVERYLVYRFPGQAEAQAFTDSDGDGVSDADERALQPAPPGPPRTFQTTLPGTACDAGATPPGATNHRFAVVDATPATLHTLPTGRRVVEIADAEPAQPSVPGAGKDQVYWYRVAAVGRNGRISELGPPVRGVFPNSAKPPRDDGFNVGICDYYTRVSSVGFQGDVLAPVGLRYHGLDTTSSAERVRIYCDYPQRDEDPAANRLAAAHDDAAAFGRNVPRGTPLRSYLADFPLDVQASETTTVGSLTESQCTSIQRTGPQCERIVAEFVAENGRILGTADLSADAASKCDFLVGLFKDCDQGFRPVRPGEAVDGPLVINDPGFPGCVSVNQEIDGRTYRLDKVCPGRWPFVYDPPALGGDAICLSMTAHGDNNVAGTDVELPCVKIIGGPPPAPTLESLTFTGAEARLTWRGSAQPTAGVFIEWSAAALDERHADFFLADGDTGIAPTETPLALTAPPAGAPELWCARARAVGVAPAPGTSVLSDWSPGLCALRMPPGQFVPSYLPWPEIPLPGSKGTLLSTYLTSDGLPALALGLVNPALIAGGTEACPAMTQPNVCVAEPGAAACVNDLPLTGTCPSLCGAVESGLFGNTNFVVLRQERESAGEPPTAWHQVSALVERPFCSRFCTGQPVPEAWMDGPGVPPRVDFVKQQAALAAPAGDQQAAAVGIALPPRGRCIDFLDDPQIELVDMSSYGWAERSLVYVDRFPHLAGTEVRYTLVYFDERGEISGTRNTPFMAIP